MKQADGVTVHPTAIVHPQAQLGVGVTIGPYSIIEQDVVIGDQCSIGPRVVIGRWTTLGKNNRLATGVVIGQDPQDVKYRGEKTQLVIGDDNNIREYVTINRGTAHGGGVTRIGHRNFIMSQVHADHDVQIGDDVIISHAAALAGHVTIEDGAYIGGIVGLHQFTRVGKWAMVGAHSMVTQDVPPYFLVTGNPAHAYGVNVVGLRRRGVDPATRMEIQRAYKLLYRSGYNLTHAIEQMEQNLAGMQEIDHLLRFLRNAERGICR